MKEDWLSREECTAMKGIAILGIMLHNYCHWLKGIARENEYTWLQWKCDRLWMYITSPDDLLPLHLLSFFGHYGVPVFLFISGFGMVMKYEREGAAEVGLWRFFRYNYLKLFRIFIVGFVLFTVLDAITPDTHRYLSGEVVAMLTMTANFLEHPAQVVWPGPYWYFSLTLQLYLLYRLLMYRRHWGVVVVLIALCWLWQAWYLNDLEVLERLRYNCVGGMLPFGMGVLAGRWSEVFRDRSEKWGLSRVVVSLCVLLLSILFTIHFSLFTPHAWLWVPALIVVGTIGLVKLLPKQILPYVVWLGNISAAIFIVHPLVRKVFIRPYISHNMYAGLLLYIVATILLSWLVKKVIDRIPSPKL